MFYIEEVNTLINELDINGKEAEKVINFYLENLSDKIYDKIDKKEILTKELEYDDGIFEVNKLINKLDISGEHAREIINIFFECYRDHMTYKDFLAKEIKVIRSKNIKINNEDICYFEGDDYLLITNFSSGYNGKGL